MEDHNLKLQYSLCTARYLHSVKNVNIPAINCNIGSLISMPLAKMTPDPPSP